MCTSRVLGQIDAPAFSKALTLLAVLGGPPEVRQAATETLKRREYAGMLIVMLRDSIKYEVRPVRPGSPGMAVKGQRFLDISDRATG